MSVEITCQNGHDLVREAVGCKRLLDGDFEILLYSKHISQAYLWRYF